MATFNEFVERKRLECTVNECANIMVELEVEPYHYIYESLKEIDPVLAEGWWDGVKNFAGNVWKGVKSFAGDVAKGAQTGFNKAADNISGPVAKFDAVERALTDLVKVLNNDPRFKDFKSDSGQGSVGQYLAKVLQDLQRDKQMVPKLLQTQVQQNYGTRGEAEAQEKGQQAQASKPAMDMSKLNSTNFPAPQGQPSGYSWERRQAGRM